MRLRAPVDDDLPALVALERVCFGAGAWSAEALHGELAGVPSTRHVVIAEAGGGAVVGYAVLMAFGETGDVQRIAVTPGHRWLGIGGRLLAVLMTEAARRGCARVLLEVAADNAPGISLYHRAGFRELHRRRDYYGIGRDAVVMGFVMTSPAEENL